MNAQFEETRFPRGEEGAFGVYLQAIRAHSLIVALMVLVALGSSLGFVALRSPDYEATAQLLVTPVPAEDPSFQGIPVLRDTGDPARTVETAAQLVESPAAADLTAERLGRDWAAEEIIDTVDVEAQGDSSILAVTASAYSAEVAARVANEFARAALDVRAEELQRVAQAQIAELRAQLEGLPRSDPVGAELAGRIGQLELIRQDQSLSLSQPAAAPTSPEGPAAALIVALAAVAGFAIGSGAALLLELVQGRVRDREDAVQLYPLPVLARVPEISGRRGRGPRGSIWYIPPEIRESFRSLAVQLDERNGSGGTVMVTSPTTGDGKTSSAINLAVSLAAVGRRVVLLDFDIRKPGVGPALGVEEAQPLSGLIDRRAKLSEKLVRPSHLPSLWVLPLTVQADDADFAEAAMETLPRLLDEARGLTDYVVLDTAPLGEVSDALRLARHVDDILVVVRPGNTRRGHLEVLRELLERVGHTPTGYVLVGGVDRPGVYGYGYSGAITARKPAEMGANGGAFSRPQLSSVPAGEALAPPTESDE